MQLPPDSARFDPTVQAAPSLLQELRDLIAHEGPMGIDRFMALALGHPRYGYYMTRDPFGAAGDFTTAPEISQMFGELLGLWAAETWHGLGRPDPIHLVELGPGRGTLMADALRAARALPPFRAALQVHLVETSPVLREIQARTLAPHLEPTWHATIDTLPTGPTIILANEFFDALPVRQLVHTPRGWCERLVGIDPSGALAFGLAAEPDASLPPLTQSRGEGRDVFEFSPASLRIVHDLTTLIVQHGGAMLAIDYGHARSGLADTVQALRGHRFVDVLSTPGDADLTAHVDFAALGRQAAEAGGQVHGPVDQGTFLRALGLAQRAAILASHAAPDQVRTIEAAVARLTDPDPGMGELFKVLAVTSGGSLPPGFASESAS